MKSGTRLDSAVFQLTPTRTRCDLVITANGKTEKIASGLLNPFLAHLKTAQDQIAKGGYSIMLEPDPGRDLTWFTKGTVERFVRFVSTPEVLERVNTIESEILQIEEAIAIQSNDNLGLSTVDVHKNVEDHHTRSLEGIEGSKSVLDTDAGKAIVLYKPETYPPESNGSTTQEENSKVQLLRVLETRKSVLQKEQGMAFARAVAAGFDVDHMAPLISFAECFGASRLMEACLRFMDLWKEKHETGQWLEIEAAEAMSSRSDFSSMNASGTMFSIDTKKQKEFREAWPESSCELSMESNGKTSNDATTDKRPPPDAQVPLDHNEYFQGQFQHPMYPHWPIHSLPGAPPVFQAYPMQGIPYYPNYPGNGPFFQSPYPPVEDPRFNNVQRMGQKRHSMESNTESETWEPGVSNMKSPDNSELEKESSQGRAPQRKAGKSGRKNSGMVVIRNINYITSKRHNTSGSESPSASDPETDEDAEGVTPEMKRKNSMRSSKSERSHSEPTNICNAYEKDDTVYGQETDGGNWQAFQNFLLRDDDQDTHTIEKSVFSMEKEAQVMRRKNTSRPDPIIPHGPDWSEAQDRGMTEFDTISGKVTRMKGSNDELVISGREFGRGSRDGHEDVHLTEIQGQRGGYRRVTNDDFMLYRRENQLGSVSLQTDPLAGDGFEHASDNLDRSSSHNVTDESYIVPLRSSSQYQIGTDSRTAIEMGAEFPSGLQKAEDSSSRTRSQLSYEPNDLSLMPERGTERESVGYDPTLDYEMQVHAEESGKVQKSDKEGAVTGVKEGSKRLNKDKKLKGVQDSFEKRKMDAAGRKGKPSKLGPSNEAQARAERLRAFKADLQKMKKENEEEGVKRLEALKRERQKRIAARSSPNLVQSPLSSQTRPRLPTKLSPSSHKGSKFSDSEPGSSSPLQRLPIRTASVGSNESQKIIKSSSRLNSEDRLAGNGLSRSASSLPELKKAKNGVTPEPKVTTRVRRLSEPKTSNSHQISSVKLRSTDQVPKAKASDEPEIKKISAIMNLDRTKAATLPELKIKTSKGSSVMVQNRSGGKDLTQKANGSRSSLTSERPKVKRSIEKTSHDSNGDENPVIEKTVVMLECETSPIPVRQGSEGMMETKKVSCVDDKLGENSEVASKYAEIHAPVSPCAMDEIGQDSSEFQLDEQPKSREVASVSAREELPTFLSLGSTEKSYGAPFARLSSLEDPCITNLECTKTSSVSFKTEATSIETSKAQVSHSTDPNPLEQAPEPLEKPRGKESSKGFKRLLKFGRKTHNSSAGERNVESDKLGTNGSLADDHAAGSAASYEVHTLKNLISQDETPTASAAQKVSRPFSLLSPFRSKTSEKKLTT